MVSRPKCMPDGAPMVIGRARRGCTMGVTWDVESVAETGSTDADLLRRGTGWSPRGAGAVRRPPDGRARSAGAIVGGTVGGVAAVLGARAGPRSRSRVSLVAAALALAAADACRVARGGGARSQVAERPAGGHPQARRGARRIRGRGRPPRGARDRHRAQRVVTASPTTWPIATALNLEGGHDVDRRVLLGRRSSRASPHATRTSVRGTSRPSSTRPAGGRRRWGRRSSSTWERHRSSAMPSTSRSTVISSSSPTACATRSPPATWCTCDRTARDRGRATPAAFRTPRRRR